MKPSIKTLEREIGRWVKLIRDKYDVAVDIKVDVEDNKVQQFYASWGPGYLEDEKDVDTFAQAMATTASALRYLNSMYAYQAEEPLEE